MIRIRLNLQESWIPLFRPLLEKGVVIETVTGCTIRDFLCNELGLCSDYLDRRVQTLFLDGRPVDDPDRAMVTDGATVALSAAMPGLLGATMRKAGRYAAMRESISGSEPACGICQKSGRVTVKLFNFVAREFGLHLLQRGVEVDGTALQQIVDRGPADLSRTLYRAYLDQQATRPMDDHGPDLSGDRVWLSVSVAPIVAG